MNGDDIVKLLDELGQRLSGPAQHVWEVAVRQQIIEGVVALTVMLVALIVGITLVIWSARTWPEDEGPDMPMQAIPGGAGFILILLVMFTVTASMTEIISRIANPEWMALKAIAGMLPR